MTFGMEIKYELASQNEGYARQRIAHSFHSVSVNPSVLRVACRVK